MTMTVKSLRIAGNELWSARDLLFFLVWRNFKIRYAQTLLGPLWVCLQPILSTIVFCIFLGGWAPSSGIPYPVLVFTGIIPWFFFSNGAQRASLSILENAALVQKIWFPRILLPLSAIFTQLVDILIGILLLQPLLFYFGVFRFPDPLALMTAFFLLLSTTMGISLGAAAFNARYRDATHLLPFLIQICFFGTPITYHADALPHVLHKYYLLNPLAGAIECFRGAWIDSFQFDSTQIALSTLTASTLFLSGLYFFAKNESSFGDNL